MTTSDDSCRLAAHVLAARLQRGELTAVAALEAQLQRIARLNPRLGAVVSLDEAAARRRAAEADAAHARGERWGPLHGVPMTLKDGHDVAGMRTTVGTPAIDRVAREDGTIAARLRAAGAILVGRSNVAPWLADYQTANELFGRTRNPWDLERTPGGSGGGAAAALASFMTPLEIGSDLGGSVRLPAAFCGLYGLKTSEHRIPGTGFFRVPGAPRPVRVLASFGPLARDLDDLRLALEILAGPDGEDLDLPPVPLGAATPVALAGLRLAIVPSLPGAPVARAIRARVARLASDAAAAGAHVDAQLPDLDWEAAGALLGDLITEITGAFSPGAAPRSLAWYLDALDRRDRVAAAWHRFFAAHDALILPATATTAFTHREAGEPLDVDGEPASYYAHGALLGPMNLAGVPALAVPAGVDGDGLPIGLQLVGPWWSELRLIELARALEGAGALPGFVAPPGM